MSKKNVLLVGVSGAGKSTLINGIAGQKVAKVVKGSAATQEISTYNNDMLDFRMIDTRGFEYNLLNQFKIQKDLKNLIRKGLAEEIDEEESDSLVSCVWYCVAATDGRLHKENINTLKNVIKDWKNVPVIVVLTKSYSTPETPDNIQMVRNQFEKYAKSVNLQDVIPVVAEPYKVEEDYIVTSNGIEELIDATNKALDLADAEIAEVREKFRKSQRRMKAQKLVTAYAGVAGVVGAVPIPFADAMVLKALEVRMLHQTAKMYGIVNKGEHKENAETVITSLITAGTVGAIAKGAISSIKAIPGINLAAGVLNAVMAVSIVELLGQTSIELFERISSGKLSLDKLNEINEFITKYVNENMSGVVKVIQDMFAKDGQKIDIKKLITAFVKTK